jgi:hypothetical protein
MVPPLDQHPHRLGCQRARLEHPAPRSLVVIGRRGDDDRAGQRLEEIGERLVRAQKGVLLDRLPGEVLVELDLLLHLGARRLQHAILRRLRRAAMPGRHHVGKAALIAADGAADMRRGGLVARPDRADEQLRGLAAVDIGAVDLPGERAELGDHLLHRGRHRFERQFEGKAGGVLHDRLHQRDQLLGVQERERAAENVDPAAARIDRGQLDIGQLGGTRPGPDIERAKRRIARPLTVTGIGLRDIDPAAGAFPEIRQIVAQPARSRRARQGQGQRDRDCPHRDRFRYPHGKAPFAPGLDGLPILSIMIHTCWRRSWNATAAN